MADVHDSNKQAPSAADEAIPPGSRPAARVIVIDADERVLFFQGCEPATGNRFWVMPGGGRMEGESFEQAAVREVQEETGLAVSLGPCVWFRHHELVWNGGPASQYERFFVARLDVATRDLAGGKVDSYLVGHRWWSIAELSASSDDFAPRNIARLLPAILRGDLPAAPFDCGV